MKVDPSGMAYDKPPGEWVRTRASAKERRVLIAVVAVVSLVVTSVWVILGSRNVAVSLGLLLCVWALSRLGHRAIDDAEPWMRGADSEEAVGATLNSLRSDGYTVLHDIEQMWEGNIDHVVSGPTGVYAIETKHRAYQVLQLRKAKRQAAKLGHRLGVWVTPVICLDLRDDVTPHRRDGVWVVSRVQVVDWLRAQQNAVLPFDRLEAFKAQL